MTTKTVLLILSVLFFTVPQVLAARTYSGEQSLWQDTVWQGEVLIDGVLTVAPGVTLEIRPGTIVRFTFRDTNGDGIGDNEIFSQGILKVLGSAEAPVLFTAAGENPRPGAWGAVNMLMSEADNQLQYAVFEYGYRGVHAHFSQVEIKDSVFRRNLRGLQFQESTVTIKRCRIENNLNGMQFRNSEVRLRDSVISGNYWGLRGVYNELALSGCRIENNLVNGVNLRDSTLEASGNRIAGNRKGLYLQRSQVKLERNLLVGNSEHGLYLEDSRGAVQANRIADNGRAGIRTLGFSGVITGNLFTDNGEYALQNDSAGVVNAQGNWWGPADEEQIAALIRDNRDRPEAGPVDAAAPLKGEPSGFLNFNKRNLK